MIILRYLIVTIFTSMSVIHMEVIVLAPLLQGGHLVFIDLSPQEISQTAAASSAEEKI